MTYFVNILEKKNHLSAVYLKKPFDFITTDSKSQKLQILDQRYTELKYTRALTVH